MKKAERIFSPETPLRRSPGENEPLLHRVFRGLNEAVPGLGTFSQAAVSPFGAAAAVAAEAMGHFRHKVKEGNQTIDKTAAIPDQPGVSVESQARVAPVIRGASVFEAEPEVDRRLDDAAFSQMAEQTVQSIDTLNRSVVKLENAVRQIQIRLDTNR